MNPDLTEVNLQPQALTTAEFIQAVKQGKITDGPTLSAYGLLLITHPEFFRLAE